MPNMVLACISHDCRGDLTSNFRKNLCNNIISLIRASQWSRLVELVISGNSIWTSSSLKNSKEKVGSSYEIHNRDKATHLYNDKLGNCHKFKSKQQHFEYSQDGF